MELIGRKHEQEVFNHCLQATESKLIAVYGRRRIGKTFLIRKYFKEKFAFEITGLHNGTMSDQISHFTHTLVLSGYKNAHFARPNSWMEAFQLLMNYLDSRKGRGKKVLFFDEMPWLDTPKSKFLMVFENFWNAYCIKRNDIIVIICGSAASWMIKKIIYNKGGLHNRISEKINLQAFSLKETERFLQSKGIKWSHYDIAQLYMAIGGVPYYLDGVKKGESLVQFINRVCFTKSGFLYHEYEGLFASLFSSSSHHANIVASLAKAKQGLLREQISTLTKLATGGTLTQILEELEQSGFIKTIVPYNAKINRKLYKLDDYFSQFYHHFMIKKGIRQTESWLKISKGQSYTSWSGFAFEKLCFTHIQQLKSALNLQVIESRVSTWKANKKSEPGAQIDMIIDRADRVVNVCEIKFSKSEFTIDKAYAKNIRNKLESFSQIAPRKNLFLTMITTFGTIDNEYYKELVQSEVILEDLFS